jgi:hypothetical protein
VSLHPDIKRLAALGWRLSPTSRSRKGLFAGYVDAATSDDQVLERWAARYPESNWVVVPERSGIWALDVDAPSLDHSADGVAALRALCDTHGGLPPRPHGRSGGGGHLLIFRDGGHALRNAPGVPCPGIDPRAGRASFTVSPSRHRRGGLYRWLVAPWDLEAPMAPDWLIGLLARPPLRTRVRRSAIRTENHTRRILGHAIDKVRNATPGERNATLNRQAFIIGGLIAADAICEALAASSLYHAGRSAGLSDAETKATVRSGLLAGRKCPLVPRQ